MKTTSPNPPRQITAAPPRQRPRRGQVRGGRLATLCIIAGGLLLLIHAWRSVHDGNPPPLGPGSRTRVESLSQPLSPVPENQAPQ